MVRRAYREEDSIMKQRTFGQHKTPISAIGYGAMSFSDFYGPTDEEKSHAVLVRCLGLGITHIDTSNVYGKGMSETRIGSYLANQGDQAKDLFTIATKGSSSNFTSVSPLITSVNSGEIFDPAIAALASI